MYLDESPMHTYIIRIVRVAAGIYVQADEKVMVNNRNKNKYQGRKSLDTEAQMHQDKIHKIKSKNVSDREVSNEECMQMIICHFFENIISLNNNHIRQSLCSILHTMSEQITNVHAKEAQRLEDMKIRSEKRKERKAKLASKDKKKKRRNSMLNIPNGVKKIQNLLQILKSYGIEIQEKAPLLEGPSGMDQLPSLYKSSGEGLNLESSSFDGLKEALNSFVGKIRRETLWKKI